MAQDRLTAIGEFAECLDHSPDLESSLGQAHHDAERAAGEFLAVATVAHTDELRCRIRCIANRATNSLAAVYDRHDHSDLANAYRAWLYDDVVGHLNSLS